MTPEFIGTFRKSSYSGQQGDCVEVGVTITGGRVIRDSKDPHGPLLHISPTGWRAFIGAVSGTAVSR
ncbi:MULTISPECIES: DUF397 domain-containing protein [Streptomyces]|uniref:DUF397 domain-containing protein n=1 Tax=Streptomyces caniscabiei TaxID=2746961 RepID=A0ABU4MIT7_9ACTN|nr:MULTISPECIES: DUF397 domain-containing protein [Streptomyces]MBE4735220.1 DUF397 domain-containing protein [Streptomyces caniscabiei]MBE4754354.1 DUF397 domain-containing protein [Streptomyces caniscabiei]MBE4767946.1 DUF397 domain-containing protein [Streptomyces caniscabiei]MBE4784402.1 DUF397 domain-containing protein [Streptomyces caniscabiei]MBE4791099.1 DUF397 domain-containing protein [Streptomyces caniscabiei]